MPRDISRPAFRRQASVRRSITLLAALVAGGTACGNSNGLADPIYTNTVDTVTLGALVGTPLTVPSAFSVIPDVVHIRGYVVRSDQTSGFDFAFNIDPNGRPVFLPLSVLGLATGTSVDPGLHATPLEFDAITRPFDGGYVNQDTVPFAVGDRFIVRSRITCSTLGGVPEYGKLEVIALDTDARTVTFQVLTNNNCGYKDLTPGLPNN